MRMETSGANDFLKWAIGKCKYRHYILIDFESFRIDRGNENVHLYHVDLMAWYALKYSSTWTTKTSFAPSTYSGLADIESPSYHAIFEQSYILLGEFTQVIDTLNVSTRGLFEYPDRSIHNTFCKDKTTVIYVIRGPMRDHLTSRVQTVGANLALYPFVSQERDQDQ